MRWKISIIILIAAVTGYFAWHKFLRAASVHVVKMRRGDIVSLVYAPGEVEAEEKVVVASELSGKITAMPVEENQLVQKGQLLFALDKSLLVTSVAQAQAGLKEAQANLQLVQNKVRPKQVDETRARLEGLKQQEEYLQNEYERVQKLQKEGSIPSQKVDEAKSALDNVTAQKNALEKNLSILKEGATKEEINAAQVRIQQAKVALHQAKQNLYKTNVFSPVAGIVVKKMAQAGEFVNPGLPVLKLAGNKLRIRARVDEENIGTVQTGQTVSVSFKAYPGEVFEGKVVKILKELDELTKTIPVHVELNAGSKPQNLALGMSADINILISQTKNIMMLPKECIVRQKNHEGKVFIVENNALKTQTVILGEQDASNIQVTSGLEENDNVLLPGGEKFHEGQNVQIVK